MARQTKPKKPTGATPVDATKHYDKRANIPTAELHDFAEPYDVSPKLLYPRDPSLDPQLVWRGKDEQDREDLAVDVRPIFIHEKIQPRAIIENVRAQAKKAATEAGEPEQMNLFADFNGIAFEELIEFYQHEQNWTNRMILGDSLQVMASLAEKEGLKGKVQMIYMDPPYGIKFGSNWQVSTRKRDVRDGKAEDMAREPEVVKAFRDTWELGIHSYLAFMRDRLVLALEVLGDTGSLFVQIGDENLHLVRCLVDEVFGSENFCGIVAFAKTTGQTSELLAPVFDYLLWYAKSRDSVKFRSLFRDRDKRESVQSTYNKIEFEDGNIRNLTQDERGHPESVESTGRLMCFSDIVSQSGSESTRQPFEWMETTYQPRSGGWKTNLAGLQRLASAHRLGSSGKTLLYKRYYSDFPYSTLANLWDDTQLGGFLRGEEKVYVVQTPTRAIERCILMTTDPGDLVLDPTCGSGTTAFVAEQWGRRWITIDTSRVALALARTRLMSARYAYYLLADSDAGVKKESEITVQAPPPYETSNDVRKGFVYKRVPHVTLKSIANNPDIKEGMTREEIDAAIARHADTETLYDQPYEDNKRIRVAGPFTVESLSPHRSFSPDDGERPKSEQMGEQSDTAGQFVLMIIDNMKKAGVQNTKKNERLVFDRLDPFAGAWLNAEGEYTDATGQTKRVAVSIGPEHGTVGSEQVKEAAKEALKGAGFELLVVTGFAFDAFAGETAKEFSPDGQDRCPDPRAGFVAEETKQYGKLPVMLARMNPDLAMGDELLKKTGSGNLFMVFGEPDVSIEKQPDGKLIAEIRGVDVYDPTTGQIRSNSTDDIACWFVDTNYNGESFFVRHAYFTGADEPYEKLKRALRAEVDEAAWSTLYSTRSYPFDPPETGKIAVKVINHYGDEVLKVYEVGK
jgi:adenine-specific DNA-methyltransferase